ncbi:MAG: FAD:protein FMN transferase [Magnetococcales bacterium]|nr:FAD:protein FMN transferase [Magnetococcales bacterium]
MSDRWRTLLKFGLPLGMIALLSMALLLGKLSHSDSVQTTTRLLMGTMVSITTSHPSPMEADQAVKRAFAEMSRIETLMSSHQSSSTVSHLNRVSRETWSPLPAELAQLLRRGLTISTQSQGAFAMGLEPLTSLWGFSSDKAATEPPTQTALEAWLKGYPATEPLSLQTLADHTTQLRLNGPSVGLDLGGIAKGYAIDQAIAVLRQEGIQNAIVDAGGDLRAIGRKGDKPWRIGIQDPRQADQVVALSLLQGDISMVTSGDYERFFLYQGKRYHHILDPSTALPADSGLQSVSVQAADATTADALSTAIFVLGAEKGMALLDHFPGSAVLLITDTGKPIRSAGFIGEWLPKPSPPTTNSPSKQP